MLKDGVVALTYAVGVRTLWGTKQMPHMVICEKSSQLVTAKLAALVREEDAGPSMVDAHCRPFRGRRDAAQQARE